MMFAPSIITLFKLTVKFIIEQCFVPLNVHTYVIDGTRKRVTTYALKV